MGEELKGRTEPRIFTPPLRELTPETSLGFAVIDFAEGLLGLRLRPWQRWLFIHALELDMSTVPGHAEFDPGTPSARLYDYRFRQVCVLVARQNGKTLVMEVLALWRLFFDGASEILSAAQNLSVAESTLKSAFSMAARHPELAAFLPHGWKRGQWGPRMREVNGSHRIELASVPEDLVDVLDASGRLPVWYVMANNSGGRSFSADLALLDELREHKNNIVWDAIEPTVSERPRNQIWTFSNAGTVSSVVLRRLRNAALRAIDGGDTSDERLFLAEWSADPDRDIFDPVGWVQANPSLGYGNRTMADMRAKARIAVDPELGDDPSDPAGSPDGFRTEYLCQWVNTVEPGRISEVMWAEAADPVSVVPGGSVFLGVDVSPDARSAAIVACWVRDDGDWQVDLVASRAGYRWVPGWLAERREVWWSGDIGMQVRGAPSAALVPLMAEAGFSVHEWQGSAMSGSVLAFVDAWRAGSVHHNGRDPNFPGTETRLESSAVGIRDRKAGDVFIWDRERSIGDPAPFIAANIAWWMATRHDDAPVSAYAEPELDVEVEQHQDDDDDDLIIF